MGGTPLGEANRLFCIFTKDLGMVYASAQGVRNISSKLRYGLQDLSLSEVSLVKGKNYWKITNIIASKNFYSSLKNEPEKLRLVSRVFSLLRKLLAGEEKNTELYGVIKNAIEYLDSAKSLNDSGLKNFECVLALRILRNLGYLADLSGYEDFVASEIWSEEIIGKIMPLRLQAIREINKSLAESHLVS